MTGNGPNGHDSNHTRSLVPPRAAFEKKMFQVAFLGLARVLWSFPMQKFNTGNPIGRPEPILLSSDIASMLQLELARHESCPEVELSPLSTHYGPVKKWRFDDWVREALWEVV